MDIAESVEVLAFGFDAQDVLRPELAQHLDELRGRGILRILDVLFVSKDANGVFRAHRADTARDAGSAVPAASTLWQLLADGDPESGVASVGLLGNFTSWEVGLDLDWVERLGQRIEPASSALLMLVEAKWATDLLDVVRRSGGFPIVFGCLERETMLVIGPDLVATTAAARAAERTAATRGAAMLEVLATAKPASTVATQVIAALRDARLLDECEVAAAADALAAKGLIPLPLLARARTHADDVIAKIARIRIAATEGQR